MIAQKTALVLGINGSIGNPTAHALLKAGWRVRALVRDPSRLSGAWPSDVEWIDGDVMDAASVMTAAQGVDALIHAVSPPKYRHWRKWGMPMLANAITAATRSGARLVLPGNVYNYGPDAGELIREDSPQHPVSRKGAARVEMEKMLREAVATADLRALVVRAGDFFGSSAATTLFAQTIVPAKAGDAVKYLGAFDVGHTWAYLPDLAEAICQLLLRDEELPAWDTFNFEGHWLPRGVEIAEAVRRVTGSTAPIKQFAWLPIQLLSPVYPLARELLEMRYLWNVPLRLDNAKLTRLLGSEPHTPLDAAVRIAVTGLRKA